MCLEFSFEFNSSNISLNIPWNILKSDLAFAHIYGTKRGHLQRGSRPDLVLTEVFRSTFDFR